MTYKYILQGVLGFLYFFFIFFLKSLFFFFILTCYLRQSRVFYLKSLWQNHLGEVPGIADRFPN